ncbi:MAG TPA: ABC transporter permease [Cyclobacteriaceae bacterium]|nr:ABC transporter permease [Cyclobacteriaceae bacterium]
MLTNFFKTASRVIIKHKAYSVINFIGLTCGLALALLIISYVRSELSYDLFHSKIDRLYRLRYDVPNGLQLATTPPPIAPVFKDYFPEAEEVGRLFLRSVSITKPESTEAFEEQGILFADSAIAKMFDFEIVKGSVRRPLVDKFTIIINEEMATKYFGNADPVGETLILAGKNSYKVVGVAKNFPENSHLRFNMLVPYDDMFDLESPQTEEVLRNNLSRNFIISHSYTYVLLKPGATPANIDTSMTSFLKKYADPRFIVGQKFTLMPVKDIHLHSTLLAEPSATNTMTNILIFSGIGILTLFIACINYINLSTAQSFARIKEIGIRKIFGSMRIQLVGQFLAESFLFCLVAMVFAYVVFYFTLPLLNLLTSKSLLFTEVLDMKLIVASVALLLFITLMAGGYPAYFVTTFDSVRALKGAGTTGDGRQLLRKVLVVFQLSIACLLLSGSLLIIKQLDYIESRPLGYQKEQIINIPLYSQNMNSYFRQHDSTFSVRLQSFRDLIETQSGVNATTLNSGSPGQGVVFRGTIPEGFTSEDNLFIANLSVDHDFIKAFGIETVAGRSFSKDFPSDEKEAFLVNEAAIKEFNWNSPEKALGKTINREGKKGTVIGVVKDFHFADLTTPVSAIVLSIDRNQFGNLSVRFENASVQQTLEKMEAEWNNLFPEKAFEFTFLDQQLNQQYSSFQNFGSIIEAFTLIAILISCLGVYGLVLYTVQRKVKEIGVRKVLGASMRNILLIIYRDFALLIAIGFLIAVPITWWLMDRWFSNFIYHTTIDALTFLFSLSLVLVVVWLTISYQAVRAASANPVQSLRSE